MADTIDVHGLPDEHVKLIEEFVNFLRERTEKEDTKAEGKKKVNPARIEEVCPQGKAHNHHRPRTF